MRITEEQNKLLEGFTCERLSSNPQNKVLINDFHNPRGESLINYLQNYAWQEDVSGILAFYIVKSPQSDIVLFFSLKCGGLFDTLDIAAMEQRVQIAKEIAKVIRETAVEDKEKSLRLLEQYRVGQNISNDDMIKSIRHLNTLKRIKKDELNEPNKKIIRVGNTYPSIEIVHFCTNENYKEKWSSYNISHPVGEVMFWKYIAPKIYNIRNIIGCQYAFLFAADASEDGTLMNYYNQYLKFNQPDNIGTNKPTYDLCCYFMCQDIDSLIKNRDNYFNNFNPDTDDDII